MRILKCAIIYLILCCSFEVHDADAIDLRARAGLAHAAYGDFNDFVRSTNARLALDPEVSGEMKEINWLPELGAEVLMPIMPSLAIGLGAGACWGSSMLSFSSGETSFSFEHSIRAYPIGASCQVSIPMIALLTPYLSARLDAYYVDLSFKEKTRISGFTEDYDASLSAWGLGFGGSAGFSMNVLPRVSLDIGFEGRYAKISGFEGTKRIATGETTDVILGKYQDEHGFYVFGPVEPSKSSSVEEGTVDLSGYALVLAMRISF